MAAQRQRTATDEASDNGRGERQWRRRADIRGLRFADISEQKWILASGEKLRRQAT